MSTDWKETTKSVGASLRDLRQGSPEVMKAFAALAQAALQANALDKKSKELIALAIGAWRRGATTALPSMQRRRSSRAPAPRKSSRPSA